jgi:hypothetical protein
MEWKEEQMFQQFHPTLSILYLRALKGAPLICLFFLGDQPQPLTVTQGLIFALGLISAPGLVSALGLISAPLAQLTGYSRRTVRQALALLVKGDLTIARLAARCHPQGKRSPGRSPAPTYRLIPHDRASPFTLPREITHPPSDISNQQLKIKNSQSG